MNLVSNPVFPDPHEKAFIIHLPSGDGETHVPRAKAYYLETDSGSATLRDNGQGLYELTCKMQGGWVAPSEMRFYQKIANGEVLLPQFPEGRLVTAIFEEKLESLSKPEQTFALCREFWNGVCEDVDEVLSSPYIHDVPLPLSDEQIEAMRKRIDEFNRAETRISKTAMPELREAMALYLVEHIDELENQDKT